MGRLLCIGLSLFVVSGCELDLGEVPFKCACPSCSPKCPDGYECKHNYCVKEGTCPESVPGCGGSGGCGNGVCDADETCSSCEEDCGVCPAICGDGVCGAAETCSSCEEDCGACPDSCGNGVCDPDETCSSCEADCGACTNKCGNGVCDPGEDTSSCPADCSSSGCTPDTTQCDGTEKLKYCDAGTWKTDTCENICTSLGHDFSAGCEFSSTKGQDVCMCGVYGKFGELCDDKYKCDPSLTCGTLDPNKPGFCTKTCTTSGAVCSGAPAGTQAECVLDNGQGTSFCGFICDLGYSCPQGMTCDYIDYLCRP